MSLVPPPLRRTVVLEIPSGDKLLPPYQTSFPVYLRFGDIFLRNDAFREIPVQRPISSGAASATLCASSRGLILSHKE